MHFRLQLSDADGCNRRLWVAQVTLCSRSSFTSTRTFSE